MVVPRTIKRVKVTVENAAEGKEVSIGVKLYQV